MFRVTAHLDEFELSTSFFSYEYALREFEFLNEELKKRWCRGSVKEYYVELKKEGRKC